MNLRTIQLILNYAPTTYSNLEIVPSSGPVYLQLKYRDNRATTNDIKEHTRYVIAIKPFTIITIEC